MAKLYFRYGAVGSAKSLNLLAVAHNYRAQGKKVIIAKPALDTRFGAAEVASRAGLVKNADLVFDDKTILDPKMFTGIACLLVDEAQFLPASTIEQLRAVADSGCPVICYGLRTDFKSHVFAGSLRLLELADSIEEVKTTCYYCNRKAVFNIKLVDGKATLSGAQVDLGCEEKYLPVCSNHFHSMTAHCRAPSATAIAASASTEDDVASLTLSPVKFTASTVDPASPSSSFNTTTSSISDAADVSGRDLVGDFDDSDEDAMLNCSLAVAPSTSTSTAASPKLLSAQVAKVAPALSTVDEQATAFV